jgi:hypothetical protein
MTVIMRETGVYLRRNYKTGNRDKIVFNGRFCNLNNGYFDVAGKIVPLRSTDSKREFNRELKKVDANLKFSGTNNDYEIFRKMTGI